jgi:hypothetical protein
MLLSGAIWCINSPLVHQMYRWATKYPIGQQLGNKDKQISAVGQQKRVEKL